MRSTTPGGEIVIGEAIKRLPEDWLNDQNLVERITTRYDNPNLSDTTFDEVRRAVETYGKTQLWAQ